MKKMFFLAFCVIFCACSANADVYVQWQAYAGFYFSATPGSGILAPAESTLAQLIWRPNNVGIYAGTDAAVAGGDYTSGDDILLANFTITNGGNSSEWADFNAGAYTDNGAQDAGGYVYARIFAPGAITLGSYYYVGVVSAAQNLNSADPLVTAQTYELNRNYGDVINDVSSGFVFQVQPVPEPGTMALFALGLATLGVSRRRRKVQA